MKTLTVADTEESGQDTETSPSKSSGVEPESQQASQPLRTTKVTPEVEPQPCPKCPCSKDFIFWSKGGKGLGKGGAKCHGKFLRDNMKLITKN